MGTPQLCLFGIDKLKAGGVGGLPKLKCLGTVSFMRRSALDKGRTAFTAPLQLGSTVHFTLHFWCGFSIGCVFGICATFSAGFFWVLLN